MAWVRRKWYGLLGSDRRFKYLRSRRLAGWVIYNHADQIRFAQQLLTHLNEGEDPERLVQILLIAASFMKHEGFAAEREYRLLKFPDSSDVRSRGAGNRLVPFVDLLAIGNHSLPIRKVIIGPGWQLRGGPNPNHVVEGIKRLLDARQMETVAITPSEIPYDPR